MPNCIECNIRLVASGDNMNRFVDTERCIECALRYRYCQGCGEFMLRNDMRGNSCRPCFKANPVLSDYSTRIDASVKLGDGKRYFGVELETVCNPQTESQVKHNLIRIDELLGDAVIMKRDGSLGSHGIEIVTRPATLEKQYLLWNKFLSAPRKGLVSWSDSRCGMHVHVSRDGLTENQIAKAVCFCNSYGNKKFTYIIAGRKDSTYAKYKAKTMEDAISCCDRHEAINLTNDATIEFRMFKGTLRRESVYKNIEFCDAILEYCGQENLDLSKAMSRAGFVRFVRQQNKWPHLMSFIMARWFGKATELSTQAKWSVKKNCSATNEASLALEDSEGIA